MQPALPSHADTYVSFGIKSDKKREKIERVVVVLRLRFRDQQPTAASRHTRNGTTEKKTEAFFLVHTRAVFRYFFCSFWAFRFFSYFHHAKEGWFVWLVWCILVQLVLLLLLYSSQSASMNSCFLHSSPLALFSRGRTHTHTFTKIYRAFSACFSWFPTSTVLLALSLSPVLRKRSALCGRTYFC